nr:unnamed protein product [Callosobruchus analis]
MLKVSKVLPIFKKGVTSMADNFRPIAIEPIVSKILEILVNEKIVSYCGHKSIITPLQFGFRNGKSTITALLQLVEIVVDCFDSRTEASLSLCDLSKAFDCVNTDILELKLEYYGLRSNVLDLLRSYLTNRQQFVEYGGIHSVLRPITTGSSKDQCLDQSFF